MVTLKDIEIPEEVFENIMIGFHLKCMRLLGYIVSTQQHYKRFHLIRGTFFTGSLAVFVCLNLIKISKGFGDLANSALCFATTFTFISTFIAIINANFQRKQVSRMIIFLHEDFTELLRITDKKEERILNGTLKYIQNISILMYVPSLLAGFAVLMESFYYALFKPERFFNMQEVLNGTAEPILMFQLLPFGEVHGNVLFYYFVPFYAVLLGITTIPCWHTFVVCLINYIVFKYAILNKRLKDYDISKFPPLANHRELKRMPAAEAQYWHAKMCEFGAREQAKQRWFTKELEKLLKLPVFADFVIFSVLMCFIYFAIAEGNPSTTDCLFLIMYLFAMMTLLWLYHFHATLITISNDELHLALYSCPWYTFPVNVQKNILLMMLESTRTLKMTALFVEMNLKTFVDIIRGAGSYFSILKNASLED